MNVNYISLLFIKFDACTHTVPCVSDQPASILSDSCFSSLEERVCSQTLRAICDMGFTKMTEIQAKSIPPLLDGRFVVIL